MGKCSIEVGTVVNGLEVLSLAFNNGRNHWNVKCTCGGIKIMNTASLNKSKGICRCVDNLQGKQIGNVLVGEYQYTYKSNNYYEVLCLDCETIFESNRTSLTTHVRPCPCPPMDVEISEGIAKVIIHSRNKSFTVLVDEEDYHTKVKGFFWYISNQGYVYTRIDESKQQALHRKIVNAKEGEFVDHISGAVYDNTRKNLRVVTKRDNNKNSSIGKNNTTGYVGVEVMPNGKYVSAITVDYRKVHLGVFTLLEDAIKDRGEAETKYGFHKNHGRCPKDPFYEGQPICEKEATYGKRR